jgi:hypothetical protein
MATTQTTVNADAVPMYLAFTTFRWALQSLRTHGLPEKVDRTAWASRSGGEQSQLLSGFKFLGLIDSTTSTQPVLKQLVEAPENSQQEKEILGTVLRQGYASVFELDLKTATIGQVQEKIGLYGPTGETRKRAARFFLKAAQYCGSDLSSRLTGGLRTRSEESSDNAEETSATPPSAPARPRRRRRTVTPLAAVGVEEKPSGSAVKTVKLGDTGGTLTLSGTFNPLELDGDERKLVYDIVDLMKLYEQKTKTASE